jgi:hypothetical protein
MTAPNSTYWLTGLCAVANSAFRQAPRRFPLASGLNAEPAKPSPHAPAQSDALHFLQKELLFFGSSLTLETSKFCFHSIAFLGPTGSRFRAVTLDVGAEEHAGMMRPRIHVGPCPGGWSAS